MAIDYRCCKEQGSSEVIEKKSRFLGLLLPCAGAAEAEAQLMKIRKQHYDARHHCFAYICGTPGTSGEILRQSDDGEPQGTAGKPLLEILTGNELHNSLLVVTRYFGGTLLGTGGLARAYGKAGTEAVKNALIVTMRQGRRLQIRTDYTAYGRLQYLFAGEGYLTEDTAFDSMVTIRLIVPLKDGERALKLVTEATAASAKVEDLGPCIYEEKS